jgi:serine/threonine protein kinase
MWIPNWVTRKKLQSIVNTLSLLPHKFFDAAWLMRWLGDFPAHTFAKPLMVAATDKIFWSAHYAEEIEAIKIALTRGMTPEAMVVRLVELQSLVGRHTLSPVAYLKGLRDCRHFIQQLQQIEPYLFPLNTLLREFHQALQQQPCFTQECLQGDLVQGFQQWQEGQLDESIFLQTLQFYRQKVPITVYWQVLHQLQTALECIPFKQNTPILISWCQQEMHQLDKKALTCAFQEERQQTLLWTMLPFAKGMEQEETEQADSKNIFTFDSVGTVAKRLVQFAWEHPGVTLTLGLSAQVAAAAAFAPSYFLTNLNGQNGFALQGTNVNDQTGFSVRNAGDVNGDGLGDLIVGADRVNNYTGAAYVVLGNRNFPSLLKLSTLNGTDGFALQGVNNPNTYTGYSVSGVGDINGDNISDVIVGAFGVNSYVGAAYVVFGHQGAFPAALNLPALNGTNGFMLQSITVGEVGISVSGAGDVNKDGLNDLIVGAHETNGGAGAAYVVFGHQGAFPASMSLSGLSGANGFVLQGINTNDFAGYSVSDVGDLNDDGISDLAVGAPGVNNSTGAAYVVFGHQSAFPASINLSVLNGSNGFTLQGINANDQTGYRVSCAGDINDDGISDLAIGAYNANNGAGAAYVVFGNRGGFSPVLNLSVLNGTNGFALHGINIGDNAGVSNDAGDINRDGISDLVIGAHGVNNHAGAAYVMFGHPGAFPASISLSVLNGSNGFALQGVNANDETGFSVSGAGDVNGDGINDLIVGAPGDNLPGAVYVVLNATDLTAVSTSSTSASSLTGTTTSTTGNPITTSATLTISSAASSMNSAASTSITSSSTGTTASTATGSLTTSSTQTTSNIVNSAAGTPSIGSSLGMTTSTTSHPTATSSETISGTTRLISSTTASNATVTTVEASSQPGISVTTIAGAVVGSTAFVVGIGIGAYTFFKRRRTSQRMLQVEDAFAVKLKSDPSQSSSSSIPALPTMRIDKGHTRIGEKYDLITKITQEEAKELFNQCGIAVSFQSGKRKTKFLLGQGQFGKLRLARHIQSGEFIGVKKIKGEAEIAASKNEAKLQFALKGQLNIMPLWDTFEISDSNGHPVLYQFMRLAGFGNGDQLKTQLTYLTNPSTKQQILLHVAHHLLVGLNSMHQQHIFHLDIKPSNFVVDHQGEIYIIDFGCAERSLYGNEWVNQSNGDMRYYPPERLAILRTKHQYQANLASAQELPPLNGVHADAWAMGITLLELALNDYPFDKVNAATRIRAWETSYFIQKLSQITWLQHEQNPLSTLIRGLLTIDPQARLSPHQALQLPVFQQPSFATVKIQQEAFDYLKQLTPATAVTSVSLQPTVPKTRDENYERVYYPDSHPYEDRLIYRR